MGIKDLSRAILINAPSALSRNSLQQFAGKRIAIDTPIYIHSGFYSAENKDNPNSHLYTIHKLVNLFRELKIDPVFVFDGKNKGRIIAKKVAIEKRVEKHELNKDKLNRLEGAQKRLDVVKKTLLSLLQKFPTGDTVWSSTGIGLFNRRFDYVYKKLENGEEIAIIEHENYCYDQGKNGRLNEYLSQISSLNYAEMAKAEKQQAVDELEFIQTTMQKFKHLLEKIEKEELEVTIKGGGNVGSKRRELKESQALKRVEVYEQVKKKVAVVEKSARENVQSQKHVTKKVTNKMRQDVFEYLALQNAAVYNFPASEHEAEAICAAMTTSGFTAATLTEDSDASLFGDGIVLSKLFHNHKVPSEVVKFDVVQARKQMGFTKEQFLDYCILLGCDFCSTLKNIGSVNALKLIKQEKSIENILKLPNIIPNRNFTYEHARSIFNAKIDISKEWLKNQYEKENDKKEYPDKCLKLTAFKAKYGLD